MNDARAAAWFASSAKTAIVVGAILTVVNRWPQVRHGPYDGQLALHVLANIAVPFCVSAYSRWSAAR